MSYVPPPKKNSIEIPFFEQFQYGRHKKSMLISHLSYIGNYNMGVSLEVILYSTTHAGNNLSGVAVQFATQFWANATQ